MTIKEIREKMAASAKELRRLADVVAKDNRDFTADEKTLWEQADADFKGLESQLAIQQRAEQVGAAMIAPVGDQRVGRDATEGRTAPGDGGENRAVQVNEEQRALALQAWFRTQSLRDFPLTDEHRAACQATGINPHSKELVLNLHRDANRIQDAWNGGDRVGARSRVANELRALSAVAGGSGGTLMTPESMASQLEVNMLAYGGVLATSEIMRTDTAERFRWPTVDDTGNKGRRLGESAAVTATAQPTSAAIYWDAYKYTSDEILVPYELLNGTPFDLPGVIGAMMGERIGRKLADDFTTGLGGSEPAGIVTKAGSFSAASATALAWDDLEGLISSVDPAYRTGAGFMFHDSVRAALKKMKDGIGRPLWQDGPNGSEPTALKGYPWHINQSMDSTISSGKKSALFGQLNMYKVRQVRQVRIYRLVEIKRENDQDAFLAFVQADGNLLTAGTAPVKVLTH